MLENGMHLCCQVASQRGALAGCVSLFPPSCVLVCSQPAFYGHVLHGYQSSALCAATQPLPCAGAQNQRPWERRAALGRQRMWRQLVPSAVGTRHWAAGSALALRLAAIYGTDVSLSRCSIQGIHPYSWITLDVTEAACAFPFGIACVPQLCEVFVVFS